MGHLVETALRYVEKGYAVIPVRPNKKAYIKWEKFQKRRPTPKEIKEWWARWPNAMIGLITGKISGISGVDIDEIPEGIQAIQEYIPNSLPVPTYMTPGGGQHMIFQTPDPPLPCNVRGVTGCDFRGEGGYFIMPPSSNGEGRYQWLPGMSIFEVYPPPLPATYLSFIKSLAFKGGIKAPRQQLDIPPLNFFQGNRDNALFHVANSLIRGGMPENEALQVLEILAKACVPPFPLKEVRIKIESALKRADRNNRNLSQEIREWILSSSGLFFSRDVQSGLGLSSREDQKLIWWVLNEMEKEGLVEKAKDRHGCYRCLERECEEIDWKNAPPETVGLQWPFGIERYVRVLPKNIICIAGEPDAGKTAFVLNFVKMNMKAHEIHFFSSEMGAIELRDRLTNFEIPPADWHFHAKERASNFADVIVADAVNVVDYLEMFDEFYKVGGHIKQIYDRLNKGIALIALQKNRGTPYGLGGMRGLEKARLYLAMEPGKVRIIKAKNWVDHKSNPNGLELDFKLARGCQFIAENDWHKGKERQ